MKSLLPLSIAAVSITFMYFVCIRLRRRGHCAMMPGHGQDQQHDGASDAEIASLRAEVAELRRERGLGDPEVPVVDAQAHARRP